MKARPRGSLCRWVRERLGRPTPAHAGWLAAARCDATGELVCAWQIELGNSFACPDKPRSSGHGAPFPPQAINSFCREVGVTRSEGEVHLHKLEHHIRADLDATSPRQLAVLRPLRVVITNLPQDHREEVEAKVGGMAELSSEQCCCVSKSIKSPACFHVQHFPGRSEEGYRLPFTRVVYLEATDFREVDAKDYYGLAPGKSVMLRWVLCWAGLR